MQTPGEAAVEPQEPEDLFAEDQEVEITDLPDRPRSTHPLLMHWRGIGAWFVRQRRLRLIALLLLCVLGLAVLWNISGAQVGLVRTLFGQQASPNSPMLSIDQFYFDLGPDWARLTIDGQRVTNLPLPGHGQPLRLTEGAHRLHWQAAPFPDRFCTIEIPSSLTDTCTIHEATDTPNHQRAWLVSFPTTLVMLPSSARIALTTAIKQALSDFQPGETLFPGEHFLDTSDSAVSLAIAHQSLLAYLSLTWYSTTQEEEGFCSGGAPYTGSCQLNGQDCSMLCSLPGRGSNGWQVAVLVEVSWTYSTRDGRVVATHMPDERGAAAFLKHFLPLSIYWSHGTWNVLPSEEFLYNGSQVPIPCASAIDNNAISTTFGNSPWQAFSWHYFPASNAADGCLLVLTAIANNGPSATASAQILYLHRFGVALALNRLAQEYNPEMPHPDAAELDLAREIAMQAHVAWA